MRDMHAHPLFTEPLVSLYDLEIDHRRHDDLHSAQAVAEATVLVMTTDRIASNNVEPFTRRPTTGHPYPNALVPDGTGPIPIALVQNNMMELRDAMTMSTTLDSRIISRRPPRGLNQHLLIDGPTRGQRLQLQIRFHIGREPFSVRAYPRWRPDRGSSGTWQSGGVVYARPEVEATYRYRRLYRETISLILAARP